MEEVTNRAQEELARADLIRRGADHDLVQAMKEMQNMAAGSMETVNQENARLWNMIKQIAILIKRPEDAGTTWGDLLPRIPERFKQYVQDAAKV